MVDSDGDLTTAMWVNSYLETSHVDCGQGKEYAVFCELLHMIPGLEAWLMESSEEQVVNVADLVT